MNDFYIVEIRGKNTVTIYPNLYLTNDIDNAKKFIVQNLDFLDKSIYWYFALIKIELDDAMGGELYKLYDYNGVEIFGQ